jgi:hypothetical protein
LGGKRCNQRWFSGGTDIGRRLRLGIGWKDPDKGTGHSRAKSGPGDFLSDHLDYAHVRFFGDTAVVQGSETWTRKGDRKGRFVWTDTWLRRNGKWQIVAAEDDSVPIKN